MKKNIKRSLLLLTFLICLLAIAVACGKKNDADEGKKDEVKDNNAVATATAVPGQGGIITDENFLLVVRDAINKPEGAITAADVAGVTELSLFLRDVAELSGIEHFTALERLNCNSNKITALDLSKNINLKYLNVSYNQLTELIIGENTALTELYCQYNNLAELDVSANTALVELYCQGNELTELDVSANTALVELFCQNNQLTELDVTANTALLQLWCDGNDFADREAIIGVDEEITNLVYAEAVEEEEEDEELESSEDDELEPSEDEDDEDADSSDDSEEDEQSEDEPQEEIEE